MTQPVRNVSVNIECPYDTVAEFLSEPRNFPAWATGLAEGLEPGASDPHAEPDEWVAAAPEGRAFVRFTAPNDLGVADHQVRFPDGSVVAVPLRAIPNGAGTTVILTLLRRPGVDDEEFETDAGWVRRDLDTLKSMLEG
ncbi:SRPBCC family protein [Nocardia callitridis]|uniref:Polyketide cyclase n=1 Tax=Nocardia callitridis TaxID=648753 RepID=A0ABP9L1M2_9NOCA